MTDDKEMSREELDKMVDEILAGTKPGTGDTAVFSMTGELPDEAELSAAAADAETESADVSETADEEPVSEDVPDAEEAPVAEDVHEAEEKTADEGVPDVQEAPAVGEETAADEHFTPAADDDGDISVDLGDTIAAIQSEKKKKAEKAAKAEKTAKSKKKKAPEIKPLKPIFSIANIAYTTVVFVGLAAAFIFLPRSSVSEIEQRSLAAMPEFTPEAAVNGGYTNGITEFFNDNVPYRDDLKRVGAQIQNLFGVSYGDAVIMGPVAQITENEEDEEPVVITTPEETTAAAEVTPKVTKTSARETTASETSTTTPETTAPPETEPIETTKNVNEVAPGVVTNGQVVTKLNDGHWWGISLFGGGKGTRYAACVNKFRELLDDDVKVYSMPIPTSGEYYLPPGYEAYNASHQKSIDSIDEQLVGVISVPASMEMWKHVNEPIYTRTDHHWQPLGAYYAAQTFAKYADVPFADISTMEKVDVPGYVGTMYGFTNDAHILNDPEVFTYYKPSNEYTTYYYDTAYNYSYSLGFFVPMPTGSMYSTFMGADNKIVRVKTDVDNGRKLIVFKDSYGNAEIPFYFGSFEEICVCDMRYFDLNAIEFIKFYGATDVLFSMCTFSAVGSNAKGLETILNNPVTEIKEGAPG